MFYTETVLAITTITRISSFVLIERSKFFFLFLITIFLNPCRYQLSPLPGKEDYVNQGELRWFYSSEMQTENVWR